jgi:hypothetical protein
MRGPKVFVRATGFSLVLLAVWSTLSTPMASARVWFVSASAAAKGNGSLFHPFNSLGAVQSASAANDSIVVLPAPAGTPPLDGGITLKTGQSLVGADPLAVFAGDDDLAPRITNSSASNNGGNAVVLANNSVVANLVIQNSWTNGVVGTDVTGAKVFGNQISGTNQSCTEGFDIFPFSVVVGDITIPIPGITGGWAAIEFEYANLASPGQISATNNYVHDSTCGDGIDLQLKGSTSVTANVVGNVFEYLQQGVFGDSFFNTVEAIGTQTADTSTLTLNAAYNFEDNLGNGSIAEGADAEGFLINLGGYSVQNVNVDHHTYRNSENLGGPSSNGFEVAIMQTGGATANVVISNSAFSGSPSDILQFNFLGSNGVINATVNNSVIQNSTGVGYTPVVEVGNNGTCLEGYNGGINSRLSINVNNSKLANCVAQGIGIFSLYAAPSIKLDVERSLIEGNTYSNLFIQNSAPLDDLEVKVENSSLTNSPGRGVEIDQEPGLTASSIIDLGGGALGSVGNNSIYGNNQDVVLTNYSADAEDDWWGNASGPTPAEISLVGSATLQFVPFLTHAPM